MAGSGSSVHGENQGGDEVLISRAEFQQVQNGILQLQQTMKRMLNERPPAWGNGVPHRQDLIDPHGEASGENSVGGAAHRGHEDEYSNYGGDHWEVEDVGAATRGRGAAAHGVPRRGHDRGRGHGPHGRYFDPHECTARGHGDEFDDYDGIPYRRAAAYGDDGRRHDRRGQDDRDNIARIKLQVPKFTGKEDPDAYFDWEEQYDQIFRIHNLADPKRVNLACVEFSGYALTWWNQLQENQLILGRQHIGIWEEMKQAMRRWFVPSQYQRDLRNRLQRLTQGTRTVDEYYKEMESLLVRARVHEDEESKMARFLHGLNNDISDFVEMFPYNTL
ncbi:uncharacterized protein LOC123426105 [Hordeum vulgare subsp. vulgare]|uniref:uncharacterized protein LOC123426105 n=1 Tax=Hordeum vulgare subsp. vulgare TaxID=112509 RepID=UPI001B84A846|nr:uncharacterized protein LOC123426105 [Hordeum vulgare subsp. vulgare]